MPTKLTRDNLIIKRNNRRAQLVVVFYRKACFTESSEFQEATGQQELSTSFTEFMDSDFVPIEKIVFKKKKKLYIDIIVSYD